MGKESKSVRELSLLGSLLVVIGFSVLTWYTNNYKITELESSLAASHMELASSGFSVNRRFEKLKEDKRRLSNIIYGLEYRISKREEELIKDKKTISVLKDQVTEATKLTEWYNKKLSVTENVLEKTTSLLVVLSTHLSVVELINKGNQEDK